MKLVKELRQQKGLSAVSLAQQAEISASFLHEIEKGTRRPSKTTLKRIADILDNKESLFLAADMIEPEIEEMLSNRKVYYFLKRVSKLDFEKKVELINHLEAFI